MKQLIKVFLIGVAVNLTIWITAFSFSMGWHEAKSTVQIRDELWVLEHVEKAFKEKKEDLCK